MRALLLASGLILLAGGLLFAADEVKFRYSGYADYHGIYKEDQGAGDDSWSESRFRSYFTATQGDVKAELRLEMDPVMGKKTDADEYMDFGADQKKVIEIKNAYLEAKKILGHVDFKGSVFGCVVPGSLVINDDVPGMELAAALGRFKVDFSYLKHTEEDIADGQDDRDYYTLFLQTDTNLRPAKSRPPVHLKMSPALTVGRDNSKLAFIPQFFLEGKAGLVSANLAAAAAFGSAGGDSNYSGLAARLDGMIDLEPAFAKLFGLYLSGDKDGFDDKVKDFGNGFTSPAPDLNQTNYFYEGGLEGFDMGGRRSSPIGFIPYFFSSKSPFPLPPAGERAFYFAQAAPAAPGIPAEASCEIVI